MKKLFYMMAVAVVLATACNKDKEEPDARGVIINGVKWASCNVDSPGTFTLAPEMAGKFYQWNSIQDWPATGDVTNWRSYFSAPGDYWEKVNDPSPTGWHVPTKDEYDKLIDANKVNCEWTALNGVNGLKFTDKASGASIFLPAVGGRSGDTGILLTVGSRSPYWSSTPYGDTYIYNLDVRSAGGQRVEANQTKSNGFQVRSVADR